MAASWLLQAIYTSLLSSAGNLGSTPGGSSPATATAPGQMVNTVLANTTAGVIRGRVDNSAQPTIFRYLGVPFAKPPVDGLRFQAPTTAESWTGVREASSISPQCWQPYNAYMGNTFPNSEDCLYLNIYTPARNSSVGLLPVMVWIHGGGYSLGSSFTYNGTKLARQGGVVVVTINYRLGVFGFLSTEDSLMPGNYGLLDQIQALKWVKENIANFGGDPNSVTIFGESAGSSSVSILVLSPLAKGLFHRAIMESGVSLAPWGHVQPTQKLSPLYGARMIGVANGCTHVFGQSDSFLKCLKEIDASALLDAVDAVSGFIDNYFWLLPRVEKIFGVLPEAPIKMLAKGDFNEVDTIRGYNSHESGEVKIRNNTLNVDSKDAFVELTRFNLRSYAFPNIDDVVKMFVDVYLGSTKDPALISRKATESSSDLNFAGPTLVELKLAAASSVGKKHYLYRFDYRDSFSKEPSWIGAIHGDELKHVFGTDQLEFPSLGYDQVIESPEDLAMTDRVMTMWSNFAKTGDPTANKSTLSWTPFTSERQWMMNTNTMSSVTEFSRPEVVGLYERIQQLFYGMALSTEGIVG